MVPLSIRPAFVALLVMAAGCGGDDGSAAPIDAATGTEDAAGPDAAIPECQCFSGESCPGLDGQCAPVPTLLAVITESAADEVNSLLCPFANGLGETTVTAVGSCRVTMMGGSSLVDLPAAGTLRISRTDTELSYPSPIAAQCQSMSLGTDLGDDEVLTLSGTGGADLPAFEVATIPPARVTFTAASTLVRGQDYTVSWTPGGNGEIALLAVVGPLRLRCNDFTDSGSIIIDGSLTQMLTGDTGFLTTFSANRDRAYLETGVTAEIAVQRLSAQVVLTVTDPI